MIPLPYMQNLKHNDTNELISKRETDSQIQRMNLQLLGEKGGGRARLKVWDGHAHTGIFKMDNQQRPTVQHREFCSVLCNNLHGKRILKRKDTCVYKTESLCYTPETNTAFN